MPLTEHKWALISAGLFAMTAGSPAAAQPTAKPVADADAAANTIADVVVTARRREEALQSVPVTITALTGEQIEQRGLRSTEDLRAYAPGVNIGGQRRDNAQFFIRGQGPGVQTTGQRNFSSVATYFAEVPTAIAGPGVFYDLSSVQVLKGPQGTLFGRNTTGGAVLFEPNRPVDHDEGYAQLTYGNYNYKELEAVVNAALVPDVALLRIAGQISRRDGFTKSVVTGQKLDGRRYEALRVSLLLTPIEGLENLTIVDYRNKDNSGGSAILRAVDPGVALGSVTTLAALAPLLGLPAGSTRVIPIRSGGVVGVGCLSAALPGCPTGSFGGAVAAFQAAFNGGAVTNPANSGFYLAGSTAQMLATLAQQQALGVRKSLAPVLLYNKSLDIGVTNRTTYDLNDTITLKNIIAFRKSRVAESADYDGTPLNFLQNVDPLGQKWGNGSEQITEEFQVQGRVPSVNLEYIAGVYHEFVKPGFEQDTPGVTFGTLSDRRTNNKDISNAVFGHLEWTPSKLFGLSGGVRQTWDRRRASLGLYNAAGVCTQAIPGTTTIQCPIEYTARFKALTYDATLNLYPKDGVLVYGSYRRGFKSGGINLPAPVAPPPLSPTDFQTFAPEKVDSFEVGLKADWDIGIPLRTNVAAFYDKYSDVQIQQQVTFTPAGGTTPIATSLVRNGVRAVNKGFEAEATIAPVRALKIASFVSYLDAHPTVDLPGVVMKGRQFQFQPKWKYGVGADLRLPAPDEYGEVLVTANWSWQGKFNTAPLPGLVPTNPSYGLLNARIEWRDVMRKGFDLAVFGNNITDKEYVIAGYPIGSVGFDSAVYGEPRMYGVSVKYRFGAR